MEQAGLLLPAAAPPPGISASPNEPKDTTAAAASHQCVYQLGNYGSQSVVTAQYTVQSFTAKDNSWLHFTHA